MAQPYFGLTRSKGYLRDIFTKCVTTPKCCSTKVPKLPTYRPKIGSLSFVDVVVQGGEVVARLHLVTLPPNHVGQAGALAGVLGAAIVQCPSKVTVTGSTSVQVIA